MTTEVRLQTMSLPTLWSEHAGTSAVWMGHYQFWIIKDQRLVLSKPSLLSLSLSLRDVKDRDFLSMNFCDSEEVEGGEITYTCSCDKGSLSSSLAPLRSWLSGDEGTATRPTRRKTRRRSDNNASMNRASVPTRFFCWLRFIFAIKTKSRYTQQQNNSPSSTAS
jgi:hypothetical protein